MKLESLPKDIVIRHRDDFQVLFESGKRLAGKYVYLIYLPLAGKTESIKIGFVCGKKIVHAVQRNRYRRLMREIVRKNKRSFAGFRTLIVAQPAIIKSHHDSLEAEILSLAQKLK